MPVALIAGLKRPVNLTLNQALVAQAKAFTPNLSATVEELLTEYVFDQRRAQQERARVADACSSSWNALHDAVGSFADEHSPL